MLGESQQEQQQEQQQEAYGMAILGMDCLSTSSLNWLYAAGAAAGGAAASGRR
jgi:hypothetical protein